MTKKVRLNFYLEPKIDEACRRLATLRGNTLSQFMREALVAHCRVELDKVKQDKALGI